MSEAVCSKSVTGGRRISWKKKLSVCLSVGSGQMVVSKKSSSETTLDVRGLGFSYSFGILHVAGISFFFFFGFQLTLRSASQNTQRLFYDDWWMKNFKEYGRQR